jgi:antibiotic biosynthesis monooxygenase (ABM) superfamily enzyme
MILHHINSDKYGDNGPVTVNVKIKAKKGRIDEFEEWLDGIIHESMKFEGHMGVNINRPLDPSNHEYIIIVRFNSYQNLAKWENSEMQRKWIEKGKDVIEDEPTVAKQPGLEFWFTPLFGNTATALEPSRYKMAIVTGAVIFVIINTFFPLIQNSTAGLPDLLQALILVVILTLLMTYVIMPTITWLLRPWLSKKKLF